jgi:hypothetical protein
LYAKKHFLKNIDIATPEITGSPSMHPEMSDARTCGADGQFLSKNVNFV